MIWYTARLAAAAVVFFLLERRWRRPGWYRDHSRTIAIDLFYWFTNFWVSLFAVEALFRAFPRRPSTFLLNFPEAIRVAVAFLLIDLILYWAHRALHTRYLWRFHAAHHSSDP